jgi:hypothetical protein
VHYYIPGHSFLPCDCDFANVEQLRRKLERVYEPAQYIDVFRRAKPNCAVKSLNNALSQTTPLADIVMVLDYKSAFAKLLTTFSVNIADARGIRISQDGVEFRDTCALESFCKVMFYVEELAWRQFATNLEPGVL